MLVVMKKIELPSTQGGVKEEARHVQGSGVALPVVAPMQGPAKTRALRTPRSQQRFNPTLFLHALVSAAIFFAVACPRASEESERAAAAAVEVAHREPARALLLARCAGCHVPHEVTRDFPDVTHIFDLQRKDWSATMSDDQLIAAIENLLSDGATSAEVALYEKFIADEIAWRDAHAADYPRALRERPRLNLR